jgi:hypothetical protein
MAGFDLGSIISSATQLSSTQAQQASQIADLNNQSAQLSQEASDNIKQAGNLQAQSQLVELQGQLTTQQKRVQAANALGTNVGDVTDIITQIGQEMRSTAVQLVNAQDKVADIEANSDLLSNPIGWLNDLVNGDAARAERDAQAQKFDTLQKTAAGLNATTQSTAQTQNAITETLTQASIQSAADATKLLADAEASKQAIAGKQYGAQAVEALRQNGAQEFNRQVQVYSQITEESRYQEGAALRRQQFDAMQEQRKKGKLEDQEYTDATARVNEFRTKSGLPPVNETFVRRTLTQPGKLGDDIRDQEQSGMRLMGGDMSLFGTSPAETISAVQRYQPKLPDSYKPAVSILHEGATTAATQIQKEALNPTSDIKKNPAAQARIVNESVKATALNYQSNIQTGKGNPYEAPPVSVVLAEPNGLKETKFGQTVLQTLVSTGQNNPTPDIVLAAGVSAYQAGELSLSEARDGIAAFYQNAVGINNATGGFLQLGVPPQKGYTTKVDALRKQIFPSLSTADFSDVGSTLFDNEGNAAKRANIAKAAKPLDLTKPTDVTLALTVMQSKKIAESILQRTPK